MPKDKTEMVYVIPLTRVYWGRRSNRAARAVKYIRRFIARHFGVDEEKVVIHNAVNEYIWSRGIEKPPRRVVVRAVRDKEKDVVKVILVERPEKLLARKGKR